MGLMQRLRGGSSSFAAPRVSTHEYARREKAAKKRKRKTAEHSRRINNRNR